ncbi:vacuolar membrane protein-domain-containing protein [Paraphoma chrysanthemicola]|uniref:peptidylprolyl isomerase n=1 Tax=Paraphoma chrysanthemicola TaxID=798071 RepID=A0A8K0RCN4_9PLEO|nr:vacuolar membrane protein-domain-containing protein [Paraphoma chrysanthemicola]
MRPIKHVLALPLALLPLFAAAQELGIEVTRPVDCVRKTKNGDMLSMNYKGTLQKDGSQFDSSYDRGRPFRFRLGTGQVIAGWDQGLLDMCPGEGRKLTIPPALGYGSEANGPIPAGSTLIFETELMEIEGVKPEPIPARPTVAKPAETPLASQTPEEKPTPSKAVVEPATTAAPAATTKTAIAQGNPLDEEKGDGECNLLGDFALLVQGALGLLAVSSLAVKRWREHPRRPVKIWFFDASKQVFGSVLLHLANILMSMLSSGKFDVAASVTTIGDENDQPNPCSFYLLNLAIDTTIGIPILVLLLKILHRAFLLTPLANPPESIRTGNYGHPPRATWWLKQSIIYFLGLLLMKLCVLAIFAFLPWIAWVGDWALRWTEGNTAVQITFVMFIFPLIMNALQYWIIDNFIKDPEHGGEGGYEGVGGEDEESDDEWLERQQRRREQGIDEDDEDEELEEEIVKGKGLKEANPTALPAYDPPIDGAGSSREGSKRGLRD